jgi:Arc/MetJ family transcription regulator
VLELDEQLLAEAASALGTVSAGETVNAALSSVTVVARSRRERALVDLLSVADAGGFDFDRLPELDR